MWLGCVLDASLWRFSGHVQLGGDAGADPELTGGIIYLMTCDPPGGAGECCQGEGCLECPTELAATATRPQMPYAAYLLRQRC